MNTIRQFILDQAQELSTRRLMETSVKLLPVIVDHLHARRVWVFGSTARGTATQDSDVDIFVECGHDFKDMRWLDRQEMGIVARSIAGKQGYRLPCDVIVWTSDEVAMDAPFWRTIQKEGMLIYER